MRQLFVATAVLPILAIGAAAQDTVKLSTASGGVTIKAAIGANVMGKAVKGAPYSADEITESSQVLSDGTRLHNQNKVTVYRDGEGRVRRESDNGITIWDPVASVSYELNPKTMTAVKSSMGWTVPGNVAFATPDNKRMGVYYFSSNGGGVTPETEMERKLAAEKQAAAAMLDKLKAEMAANGMTVNGSPAEPQAAAVLADQLAAAKMKMAREGAAIPMKSETLGQQSIQGVPAEGTRTTTTIEAGAIGNDRPINVVSERWYSNELQTAVVTKRSDPRTGEETFRLENVRRGEPGADLFMLPPGYQLRDNATNKMMLVPDKKEE